MNRALLLGALLSTAAGCSFLPGFSNKQASSRPSPSAAPTPPPDDPKFDHSAEELDAFLEEQTEGYEELGKPIDGTLDAFEPLEVKMKRGKCYRFVIRLADDAAFGEHARKGVAFKYESGSYPTVMGGPGVYGPGAVASGGCPQSDRVAVFEMYANWGSAMDKSRLYELGKGGFTAQLYAKTITEAELAKQQADTERQLEESRRFNEEYRRKEAEQKRERDERYNSNRSSQSSSSSSSSSSSGPKIVSVSIKNECRQTVKLFYGKKPKFGSGTYSSLGSNTRTSKSMKEGDMIWLVDDGQNGLGGVSISSGTRDVEILKSCNGIVAR